MATATVLAGGGSNANNGAAPDVKGRGAEVISADGNNKDCGADARSSLMVVVVNRGGSGMEPMEPIGINEGYSKDNIAAAAINCRCSQRWQPLLPLMVNKDCWLLAVVVINCAAAAMMVVNGGNSGRHQGNSSCHQGRGNGEAMARRLQGNKEATEMQRQLAIAPAQVRLIGQQ